MVFISYSNKDYDTVHLHPLQLSIRNDSFRAKQKCTPCLFKGCIVSKLQSLAILAP